jgi:hypothetical protein
MRVAEGGVGDEERFSFEGPSANFFRPEFQQQLARPGRRLLLAVVGGQRRRRQRARRLVAFRLRIAVDDDIAQEGEQLGGAVAAPLNSNKLRRRVDQRRRRLPARNVSFG